MQKVSTARRFYIDHNDSRDDVVVRSVQFARAQRDNERIPTTTGNLSTAERLLTTGRIVRGGIFRRR